MQHISKNTAYTEARDTLAELTAALAAATADEARLLGQLAAPVAVFDHLAAGLRIARGEPAQRTDTTGMQRELAQVRERLDTLHPAIEQQRAALAALRTELSATICADAKPVHTKAMQGVSAALEGLRTALAAEATVRTAIESQGYRCTLVAVASPELNFSDTESAASRLLDDIARRLEVERLRTAGPVNVRLLVDGELGQPGDVLRIDGAGAAHLVEFGRGEVTSAKPGKVPRRLPEFEQVLS